MLLLDEPTSSLVEREVVWLFAQIRRLRARGTCIIFTSHRWNEIRDIADRITVFRGGRHVGTFREIDQTDAVMLMTGRRVEALYPPVPAMPARVPALEAKQVSSRGVDGVSLTLHRGEVLGVGGLAGHGHRELFLALFGAQRITAGALLVQGKPVRLRSPRDAVRRAVGLALVPEDRKTEGLLLAMSIRDNMTLSILRRITYAGVLRPLLERRLALEMAGRLHVRMPGLGAPVGALSGGNQQKVLIGRWLLAEPQVLLLYDVTRGVDVATKHELYELVMQLAGNGHAILLYSSDAEELAHLSPPRAGDARRPDRCRDGRPRHHRRADRCGRGARRRRRHRRNGAGNDMSATTMQGTLRRPRWSHRLGQNAGLALAAALLVLSIVIYCTIYFLAQHRFPGNFELTTTLNNTMPLVLAGFAQTIVVLTRGIDLSVGGVIDLTNGIAAIGLGDTAASMIGCSVWCCWSARCAGCWTACSIACGRLRDDRDPGDAVDLPGRGDPGAAGTGRPGAGGVTGGLANTRGPVSLLYVCC